MGIQPIDLQTVYSQSSNIAKTLSGANQAVLSEEMQRQNNIQKNLEESTKVQKSSNENSNTSTVKDEGRNGEDNSNQKKNNSKSKNDFFNDNDLNDTEYKTKAPYLGTIIDISR